MKASPADGRPALLGLIGVQDAAADGRVGSDNTFRLAGALGKVRLEVDGVPPGWTVKSITAGTADLMTTGADVANLDGNTRVRVVLTDKVTELTGSVRNPSGEPATEYVVVVLPSERMDPEIAARYVQVLRPDQRGAFRGRGLPPGQVRCRRDAHPRGGSALGSRLPGNRAQRRHHAPRHAQRRTGGDADTRPDAIAASLS